MSISIYRDMIDDMFLKAHKRPFVCEDFDYFSLMETDEVGVNSVTYKDCENAIDGNDNLIELVGYYSDENKKINTEVVPVISMVYTTLSIYDNYNYDFLKDKYIDSQYLLDGFTTAIEIEMDRNVFDDFYNEYGNQFSIYVSINDLPYNSPCNLILNHTYDSKSDTVTVLIASNGFECVEYPMSA